MLGGVCRGTTWVDYVRRVCRGMTGIDYVRMGV